MQRNGPHGPRPAISPNAFGRPFGAGGFSAPPPSGDVVYVAPIDPEAIEIVSWRSRAICALLDTVSALLPALLVGLVGLSAIYYPSCDEYEFLGGTRRSCANAGTAGVSVWILMGIAFVGALWFIEVRPVGRSGQSYSMRWFGVKVADRAGGGAIGIKRAALRTLLRFTASTQIAGMGYWWALVDHRRLTWHDLIVESVVVPAEPVHERPKLPTRSSFPRPKLPTSLPKLPKRGRRRREEKSFGRAEFEPLHTDYDFDER